jgi:selenocysteine lyase/cysteine desulfurase
VAQSLTTEPGDNIILCDLEYPSNAYAWMSLKRDGVNTRLVPSVNGGLTLESVKEAADDRTRVVAGSSVQFFTGHRTDLAAIGKFCREHDILFVVDAIQSIGHIPIDVQQMSIDVLATGGHKSLMAGPGVGFLYVREPVAAALQPRVISATSTSGWRDYLNFDTSPRNGAGRFLIGTPSAVGVAGILESIGLINELTREAIDRHTTNLAAHALDMANWRGYEPITTPGEHASIASFKSKFDADVTGAFLHKIETEQGVAVGNLRDRAGYPNIRLSFGCYNVEEDIVQVFDALDRMG